MDTDKSTENPPDFDASWVVDGCYFISYYESGKQTQFIFQRFKDFGGELWGAVNGNSRPGGYQTPEATDANGDRIARTGVDMVTYEGIMDMWIDYGGSENIADELCAFWIQDDGSPFTLFKILMYSPTLANAD